MTKDKLIDALYILNTPLCIILYLTQYFIDNRGIWWLGWLSGFIFMPIILYWSDKIIVLFKKIKKKVMNE